MVYIPPMTSGVSGVKAFDWQMDFCPSRILPSGGQVSIIIQSDGCLGKDTEVNTLEHVQVRGAKGQGSLLRIKVYRNIVHTVL